MSPPTTQDAKTRRPKAKRAPKPKRGLVHGVVAWLMNAVHALIVVLVLAAGGAVVYLKNNPVTVPAWAERIIESRLAEGVPQARVQFAEMAFVMDADWRPRLRLRDVALRTTDGGEIIRFNEASALFSSAALMKGQIQPKTITLSGIVVQLKRDLDGTVSLQSGGALGQGPQARSLPELIGRVDDILGQAAFDALSQAELRAVTLRYEDLRADRAWTVDGGRFFLTKDGAQLTMSADLALLSGGAGVATLSANYTSEIGQTAATFGVNFEDVAAADIAAQSPAFQWLGVLQAPISGAVRSGLSHAGQLAPIAATLQIGAGVLQPNAGTEPIPFEGARSYFSYVPEENLLRFDELSVRSKWIGGQASGTAALGIEPQTGRLLDLVGQIDLQNLTANPDALYESPVQIAGAEVDFRLELNPFRLTLGRAQVADQGKTLLLDGHVEADPAGWQIALDGQMDGLSVERLLALWPERTLPRTRAWLQTNILAGEISNVDMAVRRSPDQPLQSYLTFDYKDASVRYTKTLPILTKGQGHFSLVNNRLVVTVDSGQIEPPQGGVIRASGSSFILPDVTARDGTPAVVRLEAKSSIAAVLSLLNMPPMSFMDKAKLPVNLAEGQADLTATLALSLQPGTRPKVTYYAAGDLLDLRSDVLVPGRSVVAQRLKINAQNDALRLTGRGTIDAVPFDAVYRQPLGPGAGPGKLDATVTVTDPALRTFGVALPRGAVSGKGAAEVEITLARGAPPAFDLRSDLRGLRVAVPQVSWVKPTARAGSLRVSGQLAAVPVIDRIEVSAPGLKAAGNIRFKADKSLDRIRFDMVEVGDWLKVPLDLQGQGAGKPIKVVLRGGSLDLRRAEFGSDNSAGSGPRSPPMQVALDRLQISETIALTDMRGQFDTYAGLDGKFEAQLNGAAAVSGQVIPQNGRSAVRLSSANAGDVLRAAGVLEQVVGGTLSLVLLPVGQGGAFDGRLNITGPKVRDAPGIAALLNAVSVVGLINELNGDGIYFEDVEASFRLTSNRLTLTEGSAVGASMGISMDGTYALDSGQIGMQGVISPIYLLNGIGSIFTRKGEGVIGFNYTLTGAAKSPDVSVNPLSALTPAIFREIFRAPPPELPEVDGITESTLPQVEPIPKRPVARAFEGR